jgi:hypothetical protein
VDDIIHAFQGGRQVGPVGHVALDELGLAGDPWRFSARMHAGLEVIQDADLVALFQQQVNGMRADKAGAASD